MGGGVVVGSAGWWSGVVGAKTVAQPKDWLISDPEHLRESRWDFVSSVRRIAGQDQLELKSRIAAAAEEPTAVDLRGRELAIARLNPLTAFEMDGVIAGWSVAATTMGRASLGAPRAGRSQQDEATTGGPGGRMATAAEIAESMGDIQRFKALAGGTNVLRGC